MYRPTVRVTLREWSCDYVSLSHKYRGTTGDEYMNYLLVISVSRQGLSRMRIEQEHPVWTFTHEHSQCVIERTWSTYYQTRLTSYRISNLRCQRFDIYRIAPWYAYERFDQIRLELNFSSSSCDSSLKRRHDAWSIAREIYQHVSHITLFVLEMCLQFASTLLLLFFPSFLLFFFFLFFFFFTKCARIDKSSNEFWKIRVTSDLRA
jgi:hypothetical protein